MPFVRRVGRPGIVGLAARTAVVAGTAQAVSGSVARNQQQRAQAEAAQQQMAAPPAPPVQAPPPAAVAPGDDMMAKLQQLASLHSQGILSDDEFAAAKSKLLA